LLGVAGIKFGFVVIDVTRNWTTALAKSPSSAMPQVADTYLHFIDWSPANAFVVDTTVYELIQPRNVFNIESTSATPLVSRAIAVLDACRLCTLSQWSPDGQFIATAFGSQISISHVKAVAGVQQNATGKYTSWESIHNLTTVDDTYMIITSMEWSPNGKFLAVGGAGNDNLFVYDTTSWFEEPLRIPTSTKYGIDALAWRPDSQQIAIGTSRIIEIREIVLKEVPVVDSSLTTTPILYNPTSPPIEGGTLSDLPSSQLKSGIGTAGMASIGIAAVIVSFSCVAIVFLQRLKFISKRKKSEKRERIQDDEIGVLRELENTMSEEDLDFSNPIDHVIIVPRTRTSHNSIDDFSME
jgi:WD domain, G-beta repeat